MDLTGWKLSGLYFVVDISRPNEDVLGVIEGALKGGVNLVQVWAEGTDLRPFVEKISMIREKTSRHRVPLIISNDLVTAREVGADGIHMDGFEFGPTRLRQEIGKDGIVGYTTGNDMSKVLWASESGADYISFCSIFPSSSVADCEIVPLETVNRARRLVKLPIFASGGINLGNAKRVLEAGASGIAVISAIQNADDPESAARELGRIIAEVHVDARAGPPRAAGRAGTGSHALST